MGGNCSPKSEIKKRNNQSCFDNNQILEIVKAYNNAEVICGKSSCINKNKIDINGLDLYKELMLRLNPLCKKEECWISLDFIKKIKDRRLREELLNYTFKPIGPINVNEWLSTSDINNVMLQFLEIYKKKFNFLGVHPSDFNVVYNRDWDMIKRDKRYMGIVLNTDPHNKPGKHWLAIFIDNKRLTLDYFDSLGKLPNKNIKNFLRNFKLYKCNINNIIHQKSGSQCGIYACFFLIKRLEGYTLDEINEMIKVDADKKMKMERKNLFRKVF